jgi:hypothetical protein
VLLNIDYVKAIVIGMNEMTVGLVNEVQEESTEPIQPRDIPFKTFK